MKAWWKRVWPWINLACALLGAVCFWHIRHSVPDWILGCAAYTFIVGSFSSVKELRTAKQMRALRVRRS